VRQRWWDRAWIPIAADGTGDLLAVDLNPPAAGAHGQVVLFQHDTPYREVVAADVGLWLKQIAELLESGAYVPTPAGYSLQPRE
jgi:cell wall assembly regulator SMI1